MPVITNEQPGIIQDYTWGLVPSWGKSQTDVMAIHIVPKMGLKSSAFSRSL
jgi:putative SOS response-associated peptidase YedK